MKNDMVGVSLTLDEYQMLLIALGFALAAARETGDEVLFANFVRVVNSVGRSSPGRFDPYEVPS